MEKEEGVLPTNKLHSGHYSIYLELASMLKRLETYDVSKTIDLAIAVVEAIDAIETPEKDEEKTKVLALFSKESIALIK
jgi:hypothetical protein